jgi:hypothetical protein
MRECEQYAACSRLSYISGDGDACEWSNGGMMISRGKPRKLEENPASEKFLP